MTGNEKQIIAESVDWYCEWLNTYVLSGYTEYLPRYFTASEMIKETWVRGERQVSLSWDDNRKICIEIAIDALSRAGDKHEHLVATCIKNDLNNKDDTHLRRLTIISNITRKLETRC